MIKLKTLVESDCNCGDSCCATNESINENVGDLKKIVKELEKASKLHAGQSKALAKASKMHAGQAKRLQGHIDEMDEESVNEDVKHITRAKKLVQVLQKDESRIRLHMWEMVEQMSKDEVNKKLGNNLKDSYKKHVTKFMVDMIKLVRKMK